MVALRIITQENLKQQNLERRKNRVIRLGEQGQLPADKVEDAVSTYESGKIPYVQMPNFNLNRDLVERNINGQAMFEFTGASAGKFTKGFFTRLRQEVQNGREEVPLLFEQIYNVLRDASIDETETIYTFSDDDIGVVFTEIKAGGEVSFSSVGGGSKSIYQVQYARGIEYTKRLVKFGSFIRMAAVERAFGRAANALQNHVHMQPILNHAYVTRNQTDGGALTDPFQFPATASIVEKYHRTLDAAMAHARDDDSYHRPGPYALLVSNGDLSTVRKALENPEQRGFALVSPEVIDNIQVVVAYRGWTGTDGNGSVAYPGVPSGTAYLIDLSQAMFDFQSLYSQELQMTDVGPEHARFIMQRYLWDMFFGVYAAPERAVEEITWPTSTDGSN